MTTDKTLATWFVNLVGSILAVLLIGAPLAIHQLIWKSYPLDTWYRGSADAFLVWLLVSLAVLFISIVIHEGLHGLGYRLAGLNSQQVHIGFQWRALMPYAHAKAPMSINGYRLAVALPVLILGVIPTLYGWFSGAELWTFFGAIMLASAVGDMIVLALTWGVPSSALVQDHPRKPGFQILPTTPTE